MNIDVAFQQTLDYLFSRLPFFTRDGKKAIKNSLDNILILSEKLGNPHEKFKTIHVAGTNGKGSVSHSLAAVFQTHGFKTGLYTSPHLTDFRERMRVDGVMADKSFVVDFVQSNKALIEEVEPSFFEITQAMAFKWFELQKVDIAIIEVGLGGRLDSTNIITPQLSVITNISFDHQDMLGDTLTKIAVEKAGIIKQSVPVVIGRYQEDIHSVFEEKAKICGSQLYKATDFEQPSSIDFQLKGIYQTENIKTIVAALKVYEKHYGYAFEDKLTAKALSNVKELTGLRGRWDILKDSNPKIIADTGHNEDGLAHVAKQLSSEKFEKLHFIMGMVNDKTRTNLWAFFPKQAVYYFCKPNIPRGLDVLILQNEANQQGLIGSSYDSCHEALKKALENASPNDLIFIGGSTFVVAELIESPLLN